MKENKQTMRKEIIPAVIAIVLLITIVIGTSYAVFTYNGLVAPKENKITTGTVSFSFEESSNGIELVNAQPMTDNAGRSLVATDTANGINHGYFDFTVSGDNSTSAPISYEVYGLVDASSTMNPDYVKVYLTDGSASETAMDGYTGSTVPTYGTLSTSTSDANGKRLYYKTFTDKEYNQKFRLRIWVADTYTLNDVSKTFILRVNVKAAM